MLANACKLLNQYCEQQHMKVITGCWITTHLIEIYCNVGNPLSAFKSYSRIQSVIGNTCKLLNQYCEQQHMKVITGCWIATHLIEIYCNVGNPLSAFKSYSRIQSVIGNTCKPINQYCEQQQMKVITGCWIATHLIEIYCNVGNPLSAFKSYSRIQSVIGNTCKLLNQYCEQQQMKVITGCWIATHLIEIYCNVGNPLSAFKSYSRIQSVIGNTCKLLNQYCEQQQMKVITGCWIATHLIEIYCNVGNPQLFLLMHRSGVFCVFFLGGKYLVWG